MAESDIERAVFTETRFAKNESLQGPAPQGGSVQCPEDHMTGHLEGYLCLSILRSPAADAEKTGSEWGQPARETSFELKKKKGC